MVQGSSKGFYSKGQVSGLGRTLCVKEVSGLGFLQGLGLLIVDSDLVGLPQEDPSLS